MAINVIGRVYFGTTGQDTLEGSSGSDTFHMTANDYVTDTIIGGAGSDTVDYSPSQVGVKITLTDPPLKGGLPSGGTVEADFLKLAYDPSTHTIKSSTHHQVVANLTSIENATGSNFNDTLTGNSSGNVLKGGAGDDVIDGRGGNDVIYSGLGADTLTGGLGSDTFVFTDYRDSGITSVPLSGGGYNTVNHGLDTIMDFLSGVDKIDLSQMDADITRDGNQAFHIVDQLSGHAGELRVFLGTDYDSHDPIDEGFFILQGDVDGDGNVDFQLTAQTQSIDIVHPATDFLL